MADLQIQDVHPGAGAEAGHGDHATVNREKYRTSDLYEYYSALEDFRDSMAQGFPDLPNQAQS